MAELLIKKRKIIENKLELFEKFVLDLNTEIQSLGDDQVIPKNKIIQLNDRIEKTQIIHSEYDAIESEIECLEDISLEQLKVHYKNREGFENKFYDTVAKAKELLDNMDSSNNQVLSCAGSEAASANSNQTRGVKLPTIILPKFGGNFEKWMEFRDIFQSLIHENSDINNIQKFHYLRAALEGTASQVISYLEFSSENYGIAWNILCDRFNNERLLIQNHVKAIFNLEIIQKESSQKLRNLNDNMVKHLTSLKQLGEPVDTWDTLIIFIAAGKLDRISAREWEKQKFKETPTLEIFKTFLKNRAELLETLESNFDGQKEKSSFRQSRGLVSITERSDGTQKIYFCNYCKKDHSIFYCSEFLGLSVRDRMAKVKQLKLCVNCLRRNHEAKDCRAGGCRICQAKHNTSLHEERQTGQAQSTLTVTSEDVEALESNGLYESDDVTELEHNLTCAVATSNSSILSTALVRVYDINGVEHKARALLDCGSQSSFMSSELQKILQLPKSKTKLAISGINNHLSYIEYKSIVKVFSMSNEFSFDLSCFIIDKITSHLPESFINKNSLKIPNNIRLADPQFHIPGKIDLLIGADVFWSLLCVGQIAAESGNPIFQKTRLGWVVAGPLSSASNKSTLSSCNVSKNITIQDQLRQFWEIEETPVKRHFSPEEILCEKHFIKNVQVASDNRYMVSLPLKGDVSGLGETRSLAIKRFYQLEKRLMLNERLCKLYVDFLDEYERLGHMSKIESVDEFPEYYMPHHGVLREDHLTTKLRVVFNASAPSSTGITLNELQMTGPIIQDDLLAIILRFRVHKIILSSDIRMMYRQVLINPDQRKFQKIIWRTSPTEPLSTYKLNTVTYGTTSASFLAIRCLHELANEIEHVDPKVSFIIKHDMYVDDVLTGCNSLQEAQTLVSTISQTFSSRGFELRKWRSNFPAALLSINDTERSSKQLEFTLNKENNCKTLGLSWCCESDMLTYNISSQIEPKRFTKRTILSRIATIFDPLGLISPCVIVAKILLQRLWLEKLSWDESLPASIHQSWEHFSADLSSLNKLQISRRVICDNPVKVQIHGFADASEQAYGACIYVKSVNSDGKGFVHLLCAKSKVAPIKSLTIPRLELCAAVVLSKLIAKVTHSLKVDYDDVFCWSDSTIVLGWIRTSPNLLKQFVDNRVAEIQRLTNDFYWKHVPTRENPADLLSRGLEPNAILDRVLWWHGPYWLEKDESEWPEIDTVSSELPEMRKSLVVARYEPPLFDRFSDLRKLKRTFAYVMRFCKNCRLPKAQRRVSYLSSAEVNSAFDVLLRISQIDSFSMDYVCLQNKGVLDNKSTLLPLNPFIDESGLIRVGGRLMNSNFEYQKKHPVILSSHHHITKLIFKFEHNQLLHAGPQLLLAHIRDQFWPIAGRNLAKRTTRECVKCSRFSQITVQPMMGQLPTQRVTPALPFTTVGIDYAGPILIKNRSGRGCKIVKGWIAIFICFTTRAVHIELVTALSTESFLKALKRFIYRRGKPSTIFSDNGTNFVSANKELKELLCFIETHSVELADASSNLGINWHFIPPNSPHFGGLWEAGVKSIKYHLRRVMGNLSLTYEDLQTILIQIEGILNSRPISPLSSDPNDFTPLTPSHFLIGRKVTDVPAPDLLDVPDNRLSIYQQLQKLQQYFWRRWSTEFVSELQQRVRWRKTQGHLQVGQMVVIKEDNSPPLQWRLGRVVDLIPGADGIARVALVKTAGGVISRALHRLCLLPVKSPVDALTIESNTSKAGGMLDIQSSSATDTLSAARVPSPMARATAEVGEPDEKCGEQGA